MSRSPKVIRSFNYTQNWMPMEWLNNYRIRLFYVEKTTTWNNGNLGNIFIVNFNVHSKHVSVIEISPASTDFIRQVLLANRHFSLLRARTECLTVCDQWTLHWQVDMIACSPNWPVNFSFSLVLITDFVIFLFSGILAKRRRNGWRFSWH